jgi:hypothetical protein
MGRTRRRTRRRTGRRSKRVYSKNNTRKSGGAKERRARSAHRSRPTHRSPPRAFSTTPRKQPHSQRPSPHRLNILLNKVRAKISDHEDNDPEGHEAKQLEQLYEIKKELKKGFIRSNIWKYID